MNTCTFKFGTAKPVIFLRQLLIMPTTVELYCKLCLMTVKIYNVSCYRMLPAELESSHTAISQ